MAPADGVVDATYARDLHSFKGYIFPMYLPPSPLSSPPLVLPLPTHTRALLDVSLQNY